jgi:LmbE family N-acetylglucosaminyl deacetylase
MAIKVLALGCHPDDIEFMMAGTLFLLKEKGCEIHCMITANGNCGSLRHKPEELAAIRREETKAACAYLGAGFHDSITNDLEVFYEDSQIRKVTAVVREVQPDIALLMSPEDYMEDHMNTCRLGVTALFCRGIANYRSIPERSPYSKDVALYHAMPYGLCDPLARPVVPDFLIDISTVIDHKQEMLAKHASQQDWLSQSQGLNSYLATMRSMSAEVAALAGRPGFAEGFRRHSHLGYSASGFDPLAEVLAEYRTDKAAGPSGREAGPSQPQAGHS